ncbi:hypothetical protein RND81_10G246200 [Saponaria officinalis]|uniref:NAC domain-containing protein n=1 Tax=Saponaria officinalis TaxID=3572 RepID=A0AAW1I6X3_SAPOF
MGLRDIGATLPPGFRFYPSDEELVCHYLLKKIINENSLKGTLVEIDLHTCEPWQLPEVAKLNTSEWYFFSFRDRKYATGFRTNRATTSGYWKATGKDRVILDPKTKEAVGMRKTLVFYRNRAPNGIKTGWIMHEFRLESPHMPPKEDWVLCRVFHKGKVGENNNNNNHNNNCQNQYMFDHNLATTSSPPPLVASPPSSTNNNININYENNNNININNHTIPCGCQQNNSLSSNNNPPLFSQKQNFIHNIMNSKNESNSDISSNNLNNLLSLNPNNFLQHIKDDDDYGFLWDMDNLEENSNNNNKLCEGNNPNYPLLQHGEFGEVRFEDDNNGAIFI